MNNKIKCRLFCSKKVYTKNSVEEITKRLNEKALPNTWKLYPDNRFQLVMTIKHNIGKAFNLWLVTGQIERNEEEIEIIYYVYPSIWFFVLIAFLLFLE